MKNSIAIDMAIIIVIALFILVLAVLFGYKIFLGGNNTANESINFLNNSFNNITSQSISNIIK
jgi:predicted negative regulator of RcsB-dependent stress response